MLNNFMRLERPPTPACMVPTGWPAIPCWNAWYFAEAAAVDILAQQALPFIPLPQWDESQVTDADEAVVISHNWAELRRFMWDYVGIVRTSKRLQRAQHRIQLLHEEINEYYYHFHVSADLLELRNLVLSADLIVQSALSRHESRGLHYSKDYPETLPQATPSILTPPNYMK
jgi:L-aspartate oxidase